MEDEEKMDVFEVLFEAVGAFEFELDFSAGRLLDVALLKTAAFVCWDCCWFDGFADDDDDDDDDEMTEVAFCEKTEKAAAAALALACALEAIELAFL